MMTRVITLQGHSDDIITVDVSDHVSEELYPPEEAYFDIVDETGVVGRIKATYCGEDGATNWTFSVYPVGSSPEAPGTDWPYVPVKVELGWDRGSFVSLTSNHRFWIRFEDQEIGM